MAKDPAFLFYPSDFLTGTMFMTNEQIGIYIRLLCSQHQHGGVIDKVSFNALVGNNELIRTKFTEIDLGFYNERLANEMEKRNKKSNNISAAVKEVWKERKKYNAIASKSDAIPLQSESDSDTIHMGLVNRNVNRNKNKDNGNIYKKINSKLFIYETEFQKLIDLNYTKPQIDKTLEAIENYKNNKKYISLFLTAKNWLEKEYGKPVKQIAVKSVAEQIAEMNGL